MTKTPTISRKRRAGPGSGSPLAPARREKRSNADMRWIPNAPVPLPLDNSRRQGVYLVYTSKEIQGSPSEWGWLDIPGASQVSHGEYRFSNYMYRYELRLFLLLLCTSYTWYNVQRCVFDCCIGRFNIAVVQSPAVHQPRTQIHRDYWHNGKSLKHGSHSCTAAAVLLYTDVVTMHTPSTHTWYIQKRTNTQKRTTGAHKHTEAHKHTCTQKHRLRPSQRKDNARQEPCD